jgi:2-alkenal reductase
MKQRRSFFTLLLAIGLVIGVAALGGIAGAVRAQDEATPAIAGSDLETVDVVKRVGPAVVTVINEQEVEGFGEMQPVGSGTGFIIDSDGHIVTNNHVVEGGQQFVVIFADGEKRDATLIGADPISDIAVVQVSGEVPGTVPFGDSNALQPGQTVLAMGSPLGSFTNTVTEGIVSATNRDFPDPTAWNYSNLIQHDAAINPGNSGGPLFNLAGEVVGVNTLGIPEENGQPVQGLFFAIPSSTVVKITQLLIADGEVTYPYLGVESLPVTPQLAAQENLSVDHGQLVTSVPPGTPAEEADIQPDDVILAIDGQEIDSQNLFSELLFAHKPGDTVEVTIQRGDEQLTVEVTLGTRPETTTG